LIANTIFLSENKEDYLSFFNSLKEAKTIKINIKKAIKIVFLFFNYLLWEFI